MRKVMTLMVLFLLTLTAVPTTASSFLGWISLPGSISVNNVTFEFRDVSLDGVLMGTFYTNTGYGDFSIPVGQSLEVENVTLNFLRMATGKSPIVFMNVTFPYVLEGESIEIGGYTFEVLSVDSGGARIRVIWDDESQEFTSSSFEVGDFKVSVSAYPNVFDGYLEKEQNVTFEGYTLTFLNATVEETSDGFIETLYFEYNGEQYAVVVGQEVDIGPFHVIAEDLVGIDYAKISVFFRGASISVETVPSLVVSLLPGQTQNVGPYVLRYDYVFNGAASVSLLNSCGEVLTTSKLTAGLVSSGLYYGGVTVILEELSDDGTATFDVFIDPTEIPDVLKIANLLITASAVEGKQYTPTKVHVTVENTGNVALSNVVLSFVPDKHVNVLSGGLIKIPSLNPGEKKTFDVTVMPMTSGNVTLGKVVAKVVAPFELACGGYTEISFSSNEVSTYVEPSVVNYPLNVSLEGDGILYHPVTLEVFVKNSGDVELPINLTIKLPEGVAVESGGLFESQGNSVIASLNLPQGDNETFNLLVIPYSPGSKTFVVEVRTITGTVNSSVVKLDVIAPKENETLVITKTVTVTATETSSSNETGVITATETQTIITSVTVTSENTLTVTQTVPYTPTKTKVIWMVVGILLGAGIIIAYAWYQARSS